ncbi:MAG: AbrB/MazE/SpoVT family DNA-binding domain-containing protein [Gammaproteobacteria bacterium]|nr:AbrB/MazE/SpoVT family DNA-binding domain-containing protein [Gammaproteobacteria bacterium]
MRGCLVCRSQAVRLPKDFRVPGDTVRIRRYGSSVVLEPIADERSWFDEVIGEFSNDFRRRAQPTAS